MRNVHPICIDLNNTMDKTIPNGHELFVKVNETIHLR